MSTKSTLFYLVLFFLGSTNSLFVTFAPLHKEIVSRSTHCGYSGVLRVPFIGRQPQLCLLFSSCSLGKLVSGNIHTHLINQTKSIHVHMFDVKSSHVSNSLSLIKVHLPQLYRLLSLGLFRTCDLVRQGETAINRLVYF